MEVLRELVLYLHLLGFAVLFGAAVVQLRSDTIRINSAMVLGAIAQVITGVALAAPWGLADGEEFNSVAVAVKAVIALTIFVMVYVSRDRQTVNKGHFMAIVGLILVNSAIAVFWL